jgi:hypothetical protein
MNPTVLPDYAKRLHARRAAELEADARASRLRKNRNPRRQT